MADRKGRVRFNVGGRIFETSWRTLRAQPADRLSTLTLSDPAYDASRAEFFFDRNSTMFEALLEYHRTNQLHVPHSICVQTALAEFEFWRVNEHALEPCCWGRFRDYHDLCSTLRHLNECHSGVSEEAEGGKPAVTDESSWMMVKRFLWRTMEDPRSSKAAKVWFCVYTLMVLMDVACSCVWSSTSQKVYQLYTDVHSSQNTTSYGSLFSQLPRMNKVLVGVDTLTTLFFILERITYVLVCPSRQKLLHSALMWINVCCIIHTCSLYVAVYLFKLSPLVVSSLNILDALRVLRLVNIFRHFEGWRELWEALKASAWEIFILGTFIFMGMMLFASLLFAAQFGSEKAIANIPQGFWWAVVTMTTVGYGDIYPTTVTGYMVGGCCALAGMLATGLPIPIISNNFSRIHGAYKLSRQCLERHRKMDESMRLRRNARSDSLHAAIMGLPRTEDGATSHCAGSAKHAEAHTLLE